MSDHAPTPYEVDAHLLSDEDIDITTDGPNCSDHRLIVATVNGIRPSSGFPGCGGNPEATARFIVRACNSHEELVEALESSTRNFQRLIKGIGGQITPPGKCALDRTLERNRAALADAKEPVG